MTSRRPSMRLAESITIDELERDGGFRPRDRPLLVKGAVTRWPAWKRWSFERLAEAAEAAGSTVVTSFQNGLVEQGVTRPPLHLPVAPYLRRLGREAEGARARDAEAALCPDRRLAGLEAGAAFDLRWDHLGTFVHDQPYLAQWDILRDLPGLRDDFAIRSLWPGWRWTWEYVFIGPARTVTGLHYDFPSNWFCQVRGVKEFILFPPENDRWMSRSRKYDWGATLSDIDITRLEADAGIADRFAHAEGLYARVEPGDALFVPRRTWHAVVALEPSISLAVFGLTIPEIVFRGGASEARSLLHRIGLYRRGNCTCHAMAAARP